MKKGIGFLSLLGLLFIGLKLAHQIDWSWWYVLLPIYLPWAIALLCALLIGGLCMIFDFKITPKN